MTGLWTFGEKMYRPLSTAGGPSNAVNAQPAQLSAGGGNFATAFGAVDATGPYFRAYNANIEVTGTGEPQSGYILPADRITMLLVMTVPAGFTDMAIGAGTFGTDCCRAHCPAADTVIYFDYGGASGVNRLTSSALTWTEGQTYKIAFVAGARGSSIYRNGVQLATQTTAVSRTLGNSFKVLISGSNTNISYVALLNNEWLPSQVMEWMANPYAMLSRRANIISGLAMNSGAHPWWFADSHDLIGAAL